MTAEYVNESPVKSVSLGEAKRSAAALQANLKGWGGTGEAAWDKRVADTGDIAFKLIKDKGGSHEEAYVYVLDGAVAGVMVIDEDLSSMHIKFMVTHPGTQGVGGTLMEAAVERSCKENYEGRLELISHSDESTAAYEALGFVKLAASKRASHLLSPVQAAQWEKSGDTFKLAKYLGRKFIG